jgi:hypothetical protein
MDTEEQIFRDVAFSLDINDDVYQKTINTLNILYERDKMGGNKGIHLTPTNINTEEDGN